MLYDKFHTVFRENYIIRLETRTNLFFQCLFAYTYIHRYRETHRKTSVGRNLLISSSLIPVQSKANLEVRFKVKIRWDCSGSHPVEF